jgi:U3 small nucleolar RNA-associated protein 11
LALHRQLALQYSLYYKKGSLLDEDTTRRNTPQSHTAAAVIQSAIAILPSDTIMSSSLRNAVKRVTHKERAQPRARSHLGILEKHKDYTVRAKDYHKKENVIKALQTKASMKNPDEFYFGMHKAQIDSGTGATGGGTGTGKHRKTMAAKQKEFEDTVGVDTVRIMKDQDLAYVRLQKQKDLKKVQKLQSCLHHLDNDNNNETASGSSKGGSSQKKRKHTIFVESKQQAETFDAAKHFDTLPELVGRAFNRPRLQQLKQHSAKAVLTGGGATSDSDDVDDDDQKAVVSKRQPTMEELEQRAKLARKVARKLARARNASYGELQARHKRIADMERAESHLVTEKLVASKGRKRKIQAAENGRPAVYKWRRKRLA